MFTFTWLNAESVADAVKALIVEVVVTEEDEFGRRI